MSLIRRITFGKSLGLAPTEFCNRSSKVACRLVEPPQGSLLVAITFSANVPVILDSCGVVWNVQTTSL